MKQSKTAKMMKERKEASQIEAEIEVKNVTPTLADIDQVAVDDATN